MRLLIIQDRLLPQPLLQLHRFSGTLLSRVSHYDVLLREQSQFSSVNIDAYDLVIICGSKYSLADDAMDWFDEERALIHRVMALKIPCLGICFGAQHLAKSMGANIQRMPSAYNLLDYVSLSEAGDVFSSMLSCPALFLHHDSIVDLTNVDGLSYRKDGAITAFQHGGHIWGLQQHLEMTLPLFEYYCASYPKVISQSENQRISQMLSEHDHAMQRFADQIIGHIVRRVDQRLSV